MRGNDFYETIREHNKKVDLKSGLKMTNTRNRKRVSRQSYTSVNVKRNEAM